MSRIVGGSSEAGGGGRSRPVAAPPQFSSASVERRAFVETLERALERCARTETGAALLVIEVEPQYLRRSEEHIPAVLAQWDRRGPQSIRHYSRIDQRRYALFVSPLGAPGHARQLAERLAQALDPRICPLLRRALPHAWWGMAYFSSDRLPAETWLTRAEQDLEQRRRSETRCSKVPRARRRHAEAARLQPSPLR